MQKVIQAAVQSAAQAAFSKIPQTSKETLSTGFEGTLTGALEAARKQSPAKAQTNRQASPADSDSTRQDALAQAQAAAVPAQETVQDTPASPQEAVMPAAPAAVQEVSAQNIAQIPVDAGTAIGEAALQEFIPVQADTAGRAAPDSGLQVDVRITGYETQDAPDTQLDAGRPVGKPASDSQGAVDSSVFEEAGRKLDELTGAVKQESAQDAGDEAMPQEKPKFKEHEAGKLHTRSSESMGFLKAIRREEDASSEHYAGAVQDLRSGNSPKIAQMPQEQSEILSQPKLYDQLSEPISRNVSAGRTEFVMQLRPQELGEVRVRMVLEGGMLALEITAATQKATEQLSKQLDSLAASLRTNGIQVQEINLNTPAQQTQSKQDTNQEYYRDESSGRNRQNERNRDQDAGDGFEDALSEQAMAMSGAI